MKACQNVEPERDRKENISTSIIPNRSSCMRRIRLAILLAILLSPVLSFRAAAQDMDFDALLDELTFEVDETAPTTTPEPAPEPEPSAVVDDEELFLDDLFGEEPVEAPVEDFGFDDEPAPAPVEPEPSFDDLFGADDVVEAAPVAPVMEDEELFGMEEEAPAPVEEPVAEVEPVRPEVEKPLPAVAPAALSGAALLAQQEEVRRQALEVQARKNFEDGLAALSAGNYDQAVKLLEAARRDMPVRPVNEATREKLRFSLGDAYYSLAEELMDIDLALARRNIELAKQTLPESRRVQSLDRKIGTQEVKAAERAKLPVPVGEQPKYADKYEQIDLLLREGRDLYDAREYNDAEKVFESVLVLDEYNVDAMRYLRRIEEQRYAKKTRERDATAEGMMAMVRDTWNPPIRSDVVVPTPGEPQTQIEALTAQQKLQGKMEDIVIPFIEFRQANIADVVNFLVDASVAGDPEGVGVNIILKLGGAEGTAPAPAPVASSADGGFDDFGFGGDFGAFEEPAVTSSPAVSGVPAITLNLRRINLLDAIKYITEVADLRFRIEDNVVVITPANVVSGRVITRMYPVQPSILDVIVETGEQETTQSRGTGEFIGMGAQTTIKRGDVKDFFERAGVPFPAGTSITYNQSISQLIVANTVENLENFERILSRLNVIPNQVEIEARFVEVNQQNLDELGLQWFLTDNWEIAQKQGGTFPGATESVVMRADPQGLTKANRFFGADLTTGAIDPITSVTRSSTKAALGGVATFASVLTNPELQVVINAIAQKGNSDLLSAPRVTTRSGVNAQIQVVNEIIYPTDFESEVITIRRELDGGGTTEERFVTVTPGSFAKREVGVILNVTPTVGPDGYTIDLTLAPEVAELVDWIQYGSSYGKDAAGDPIFSNIPQPTFASRKVNTSIVVWDGQTVVMGGLIREDLVKYEDKVPLLGDIPLIGRLFRSEGEYSQKKNLLIFVTARLVGPDGRPIQRENGAIPGAETAEAVTP
jgi:general secretion pathway protein D